MYFFCVGVSQSSIRRFAAYVIDANVAFVG